MNTSTQSAPATTRKLYEDRSPEIDPSDRVGRLQTEIAALERTLRDLDNKAQPLRDQTEALRDKLRSSEDVLRQMPGSQRHEDAIAQRRQQSRTLGGVDNALSEINEQMTKKRDECTALREQLSKALQPAVTANTLQAAIDTAAQSLAKLQAERQPLEAALSEAMQMQASIDAAEQAERESTERLDAIRAEAFTTRGSLDAKGKADIEGRITDADLTLSVARETAAGARAARPGITKQIERRRFALRTHDDRVDWARQLLGKHTAARAEWLAYTALDTAVSTLGQAVAAVYAADRENGVKLINALRNGNFETFDDDDRRRLVTPQWLKRGAVAP